MIIAVIALLLAGWSAWATWQNTKSIGEILKAIDGLKNMIVR